MGRDRFVRWSKKDRPEWGEPTLERLAQVARDFLGPKWKVYSTGETWLVCECKDKGTFALRSERDDKIASGPNKGQTFGEVAHRAAQEETRGFEVFFLVENGKIKQTSVITRHADEFTSALADRYAAIIARWWHGKVQSG